MSFDIVVADWLIGTAFSGIASPTPATDFRLATPQARNPVRDGQTWTVRFLCRIPLAGAVVDDAWRKALDDPAVRRALQDPHVGLYVVDQDGNILWANDGMLEVTGHVAHELLGHNAWGVLVPPEDLPEVARFKASLSESDGCIWMRIVTPTGARRWVSVDTWLRHGAIVCAFRRATDPARHRIHFVRRARPSTGHQGEAWAHRSPEEH